MEPHDAPAAVLPPDPEEEHLVQVLERYLSDLESGRPVDPQRLFAEHPSIAFEDRIIDAAKGAALGTGTTMSVEVTGAVYNVLPNEYLSGVMNRNLERIGGFAYTPEEACQRAADVGLDCAPANSIGAALEDLLASQPAPMRILICGSLYVAGEVLARNG